MSDCADLAALQLQVLLSGMGRFGQLVARLLTAQHIPFVALEHSPETVDTLRRFGIEPNVALLSHSNFGSSNSASARKMRAACEILHSTSPDLNVDGEMHGDAALSVEMRDKLHPDSRLKGEANLLVMPNLDAANISFNLMKMANGDGVSVGPILLGAAKSVHIVTPSATVRRLVNMTALAVVDAQASRAEQAV